MKLVTEATLSDVKESLAPPGPEKSVWIQVGRLIDGAGGPPVSRADLVYNGERILYVGGSDTSPSAEILNPGQRDPHLRLPDFTVLPGLIESHAHLFLEGAELDLQKRKAYLAQSREDLLRHARRRLERLIRIGVMAVRDAGDKDGVGLALSSDYKNGESFPMPYLDSPGAAIHHQGRYGAFMGEPIENFNSPEECVNDRIRHGADRIKLIPTGIINFEKGRVTAKPQMPSDEIKALVDAAHAHGKQTFAHASGTEGIENALQGGVDSVEHGFFVTSDQLARMRDQNTAWSPTFTPVRAQVEFADQMGWSVQTLDHLNRILEAHAKSLVRAREIGVHVVAGSDAGSCGVPHGFGFLSELERMEEAGLSSGEVLFSATGIPANRLEFRDPIGMLRPGRRARFILTRYNPLETVKNLRKEKICFFDGLCFESDENPPMAGM